MFPLKTLSTFSSSCIAWQFTSHMISPLFYHQNISLRQKRCHAPDGGALSRNHAGKRPGAALLTKGVQPMYNFLETFDLERDSMKYENLRFPGGLQKAVTFSYDDGCRHDVRLSETVSSYGIKCTFNISSAFIKETEGEWYLSEKQIRENILDKGHEIAVHGHRHRAPGVQRPIEGIKDVLECRLELEKRFGVIVRGMAYPDTGITVISGGQSYDEIRRYLTDLDIVYARSLGGDNDKFLLPGDWLNWIPTAHHANPDLFRYIDKFNAVDESGYDSKQSPALFYLWGHSFEFDRSGNWELLDKICKKLSGRSDVWYATNMEIYDYVTAYRSLVHSADGSVVYNPTLKDIWFKIDKGETRHIAPGETLKL